MPFIFYLIGDGKCMTKFQEKTTFNDVIENMKEKQFFSKIYRYEIIFVLLIIAQLTY